MISNRATSEGTAAYAQRFPKLGGNYRPMLGMMVSSIGIGTYLGEHDEQTDADYEAALRVALLGGINLIDTAVNYRFQRSERSIGRVLKALVGSGELRREEVVVATKGGYITFDGTLPANSREWFNENYVKPGIIGPGELVEGSHCMTPRYLERMLAMSLDNLGLECVDIYYLHNPETQLAAVARDEFLGRVRSAFELLETKAADGKIGVYGVATWNAFRVAPQDQAYLSIAQLAGIAREVGGENHRFRIIQMPYNLAMPEAFTVINQALPGGSEGSPLAAAAASKLAVCASASMLQGRLARRLPGVVAEAMPGLASDAQRAVQFVRSTPGIDVALVGMKTVGHVREALELAAVPPVARESLMKLFRAAPQP
jgi:aryl-alcohol dehydrogenase-like predicted oxidoreductase